jgi:DNA-binding MarR family transcriptional regulator
MDPVKYDIEGSFGSVVRRADMALINRLNQHFKNAGYDITTEQYRVLVNLWNKDGQNQQALSTATRKNKTSMTRLINGLEKRNLVVRVPGKDDQRNKLIYLTPKAKALPGKLTRLAKRTLGEAQRGITAEELEACKQVLLKVIENL